MPVQTENERAHGGVDMAPSGIEPDSPADGEQHHGVLGNAVDKLTEKKEKVQDKTNPPGGYDPTPIPKAADGYTVRFTFHRANNLPISDLHARSSDPYIHATLTSDLMKRHKEDPDLILRTKTIHRSTDPVWNSEWIVAGIPSSGFRLKCRLFDEDPNDHDDRLGNVTVHVGHVDETWAGIKEEEFEIKKRMGSKRAYGIRGCAAMFSHEVHMTGTLTISAEVLERSEETGRMYTVGPLNWAKHYSPMIGRLVGTKAPGDEQTEAGKTEKYE
jgi:hypothetical protein